MKLFYGLIASSLILFSSTAFAKTESNVHFGATIGQWLSGGDVSVDNDPYFYDLEKESCLLLRGFLDYNVAPTFQCGLFLNAAPTITYEDSDVEQSMFEFGFAFKFVLPLSEKVAIRPGFEIGRRMYSSDDDIADDIQALGLNMSFDLLYEVSDSFMIIGEFGFLSQPLGGNDDWSMAFPPIWYVSVGAGI